MEKPVTSLSINSHFRHAGPDPASRRCPDDSREPFQRLGPGFHREPWIPAGVYPDENRGWNDTFL